MSWFSSAIAVFEKDARLELRSRYAINTLVLFAVSSLLIVAFAIGSSPISTGVRSVLLWIIILFTAIAGLSHAFVSEEDDVVGVLVDSPQQVEDQVERLPPICVLASARDRNASFQEPPTFGDPYLSAAGLLRAVLPVDIEALVVASLETGLMKRSHRLDELR